MENRQEVAGGDLRMGRMKRRSRSGGRDRAIVILLMAAVIFAWLGVGPECRAFPVRVLWWIVQLAAVARLLQQFGTEWLRWTIRHQPALCVLLTLTLASCLLVPGPGDHLQKAASLLGSRCSACSSGTPVHHSG
jgi:hypothetical protein